MNLQRMSLSHRSRGKFRLLFCCYLDTYIILSMWIFPFTSLGSLLCLKISGFAWSTIEEMPYILAYIQVSWRQQHRPWEGNSPCNKAQSVTVHLLQSILFCLKSSNFLSINFTIQTEKTIWVKHVTAADWTSLFNILVQYNFAVHDVLD